MELYYLRIIAFPWMRWERIRTLVGIRRALKEGPDGTYILKVPLGRRCSWRKIVKEKGRRVYHGWHPELDARVDRLIDIHTIK